MADLFDRMIARPNTLTEETISVHGFFSALVDYANGQGTTRTNIINYWSLDASATADLDALLAAIDGITSGQQWQQSARRNAYLWALHAVAIEAEEGARYTTKAAFSARLIALVADF